MYAVSDVGFESYVTWPYEIVIGIWWQTVSGARGNMSAGETLSALLPGLLAQFSKLGTLS